MAMKIMGLVVYSVAGAEVYLRTNWHLDPSSCLATIDMGQQRGGAAVPLSGYENNGISCVQCCLMAGPHLTQCGLGQGLPPYQVAS